MYIVIDVETTMKNKGEDAVGEFSATPWHVDNRIVLLGAKSEAWSLPAVISGVIDWNDFDMVVGHNIKFDLAYLCKEDREFKSEFSRLMVWDTMLAEYILDGQDTTFPSLDDTAIKYGGALKDTRVKHMMAAGICPSEYPKELLDEYLKQDVTNTEIVFLGQLKRAKELGMINLLTTKMMALKATFSMEWNGMKFDKDKAHKLALKLETERSTVANYIRGIFENILIHKPDINIASTQQLSLVLFGGLYTTEDKEVIGTYKSGVKKGQPKFKTTEVIHYIEGFKIPSKDAWKTKVEGIYQTNDNVLKELLQRKYTGITTHTFLNAIQRFRELNKEIDTYYKGYSKLVWHDGYIHPTFNHTSTKTGRLSCAAPNLQNVTRVEE